MQKNLEYFWNPSAPCPAACLSRHHRETYIELLQAMLLIRCVERKLALGKKEGLIGGPVHLGIGQEAVAAGVSSGLRGSDAVFGAHRSHSHILALNTSVWKMMAEVLAKAEGLCGGRGGSMHLVDRSVGFLGSVPIVSGTVPLAVGAAIAAKRRGCDDVAVAYLGDGACEEGVVHESLNMATTLRAPVLFVVENNLYASHMHISERQPSMKTARYAEAHGVKNRVIDGNDVVEVHSAASDLLAQIRKTNEPAFLECITYRWLGHVDHRDDIDVGITRTRSEVEAWKKRDPIKRLVNAMVQDGFIDILLVDEMKKATQDMVDKAWERALNGSCPPPSELLFQTFA